MGTEKRKNPNRNPGTAAEDEDFFKVYVKPGYKRLFLGNSVTGDFNVFIETTRTLKKNFKQQPDRYQKSLQKHQGHNRY